MGREREGQSKGRGGGRRKGGKKGEREKNSEDSDLYTDISLKDRTKACGGLKYRSSKPRYNGSPGSCPPRMMHSVSFIP